MTPLDPVDPADPVDPVDPVQGGSDAGIGAGGGLRAAPNNPDLGLFQGAAPNPDSGFVAADPDGPTLQINPNGQDGVELIQTRNRLADNTVTSVAAAAAPAADLRALDRTVGETRDFTMAVGETVVVGRLAVRLSECRYPVDNPNSDAFAHLQIADLEGRALFEGWMIASSPALMALEHPRYDVWVLSCRTS